MSAIWYEVTDSEICEIGEGVTTKTNVKMEVRRTVRIQREKRVPRGNVVL